MDTRTSLLPDFAIAHFPGGGGRGYAQVITEVFLEGHTNLSLHQLLPNIISGSVGFLITAPLYLPHPDDPNRPLLTAQELCDIFPSIASNLPKKAGLFLNRNDRTPLEQALLPYLGDYKLKDFIGSIHTTSHGIGRGSESCVRYAKYIDSRSGKIEYSGDPETTVMDIALAGTALPPVFRPHKGQIDLAFSNSIAVPVERFRQIHDSDAKGLYIRLGNFRMSQDQGHHRDLEVYGHFVQSLKAAIGRAISDHTYSQNIQLAETIFKENVYNLEQEITPQTPNAPSTSAILTTDEQFKRIKELTQGNIHKNFSMYAQLADTLGEMAVRRMNVNPDASFGNHSIKAVRTKPFTFPPAANDDPLSPSGSKEGKAVLSEVFMKAGRSRVIGALMGAWQALGLASFGHQLPANANQPTPTDQIQRSTTRQPSQEIANDLK